MKELLQKEEKKVEYLELIYDLIFVYIIGRNNSLLHLTENGTISLSAFISLLHLTENGTISLSAFISYVVCTLDVIQIWNFSTYYINIYGKNGLREHIFLFSNMFLLYFIGVGTQEHWQKYHTQYHAAWALILLNIALQYAIEMRNHDKKHIKTIIVLGVEGVETAIVLLNIPIFQMFGYNFSYIPILFGIVATLMPYKNSDTVKIDFAHLSERAMLYVVFTFGEMVIAIAEYFHGDISFNLIFFAFMAFLIVAGLFLSYGTFYDKIIDREQEKNGLLYMFFHVFIIFGINNITASLEFMRDEEMSLIPKIIFLIGSFLIFYIFLFMTRKYAKKTCKPSLKFYLKLAGMVYINISVSVIFVFSVYGMIYRLGKYNTEN